MTAFQRIRFVVLAVFLPPLTALAADNGSWRIPLAQKTAILEKMLLDRHWIDGLYTSQVELGPDGRPDYTTTGHCDVTHSVSWHSYYICGQVLRWQKTRDPAARAHVRKLFDALHQLHVINGRPGTLARGWHLGHGPTYEERAGRGASNLWFQAKGPYKHLRVRGFPSHHTYSGVLRACGMLYDFFCNDEEKRILRDDVSAIAREVYIKNKGQIINHDGSKGENLLFFTPPGKPNEQSLFYICGLGVAAHITGAEDIRAAYKQAVQTYRILDYADADVKTLAAVFPHGIDNDDAEHLFGHLYNMVRIEKDPKLLKFYRLMADVLWHFHKNDRQAYYNIIYKTIRPDADVLADAIGWLKHYPTHKRFVPRMNSIRPDIDKLPKPLPLSMRPFDNEYDFKGNPYQLDGWLSRDVTDIEVSAEDPYVRYAVGQSGKLYRTLDGGETWHDHFAPLAGAFVNDIFISTRKARILLAATDRGLLKSDDAGVSWRHVDLPDHTGPVTRIISDDADPQHLFALTHTHIFRSVEMPEEYFGEVWQPEQNLLPPGGVNVLATNVRDGKPTLYGSHGQHLWKRQSGRILWKRVGRIHPAVRATFQQLAIHPTDSQRMLAIVTITYAAKSFRLLAATRDGGNEWKVTGRIKVFDFPVGQGKGLENASPLSVAYDPGDGRLVYLGASRSFYRSTDGGLTFAPSNVGLDIPRVRRIFADRTPGLLFVSTPAGLFLSEDKGESFKRHNLVLQFDGCRPREVGPADYLVAYWIAKYHGFITDKIDNAPFAE